MTDLFSIDKGAVISDCGQYRYMLWRRWDKTLPRLIWIMLNPSSADAELDDPTTRVCMGRARRMGFGGIRMLNLFAFRATSPADMMAAVDPVGPENDRYLEMMSADNSFSAKKALTIAAWGIYGGHLNRQRHALSLICGDMGHQLHALRLTLEGYPCHPLRIPYSQEPRLWMDRDRYYASPR